MVACSLTGCPPLNDSSTPEPSGRSTGGPLARLRASLSRSELIEPGFWRHWRREILVGRRWGDRAVVLAFAALTGLTIVVFALLSELALVVFRSLTGGVYGLYVALVWTPLLTAAVVWATRRFAPAAAGSGIPQVLRALDADLHPSQRHWLVSWRVAVHKVILVSGGLLAGLSIGREGPAAQVGAGTMAAARKWLSPRSGIDTHDLLVAGAAAGVAAAFNTPLGGIVFALEQLSRRRGISHTSLIISAIVLSGLIAVASFGNETYFGRLQVQSLSWALFVPGLVITVLAGLSGGLFARLLVVSMRGLPDRFSQWRSRYPLRFASACGLAVAVIGLVTHGATSGAGYFTTRALLEGRGAPPDFYTVLKLCATWLSMWSGAPAGVFAPSLAIGAGLGNDIATLFGFGNSAAIPLIAFGMVAFLAAVTGGPITAFIIVMEMVSGQALVLSLMACALLASALARLVGKPMYLELACGLSIPPAPTEEKDRP